MSHYHKIGNDNQRIKRRLSQRLFSYTEEKDEKVSINNYGEFIIDFDNKCFS